MVTPRSKNVQKTNIFGPNLFLISAKMKIAPTFLEVQALQ